MLIGAVVLAALLTGGLANVVGQFFRLLILFPIAMGLVVGFTTARIATQRKVRAPMLLAALAAAGGLGCWMTDFGLDYLRARAAIREQIVAMASDFQAQGMPPASDEAVDRCVDITLLRWGDGLEMSPLDVAVNLTGEAFEDEQGQLVQPQADPSGPEAFLAHVRAVATEGTVISRHGNDGPNIGNVGTLLLWLAELLIAAGTAGYIGHAQGREPFCERCRRWYGDPEQRVLGNLDIQDTALTALERGDAQALGRAWSPPDPKKSFLVLAWRRCPGCGNAPRHVELVALHAKGKQTQRKTIRSGLVEATTLDRMIEAIDEAATA